MKAFERKQGDIRIIEPFPFFLSKQTTEPGKADGYGLQWGSTKIVDDDSRRE
jgi:hypothetical protein